MKRAITIGEALWTAYRAYQREHGANAHPPVLTLASDAAHLLDGVTQDTVEEELFNMLVRKELLIVSAGYWSLLHSAKKRTIGNGPEISAPGWEK